MTCSSTLTFVSVLGRQNFVLGGEYVTNDGLLVALCVISWLLFVAGVFSRRWNPYMSETRLFMFCTSPVLALTRFWQVLFVPLLFVCVLCPYWVRDCVSSFVCLVPHQVRRLWMWPAEQFVQTQLFERIVMWFHLREERRIAQLVMAATGDAEQLEEAQREFLLTVLVLHFGAQPDEVFKMVSQQLRERLRNLERVRVDGALVRTMRQAPELHRHRWVGRQSLEQRHMARTGKRILEVKGCYDDKVPDVCIRNVSSLDLDATDPASPGFEEHTFSGEVVDALAGVKKLCQQNKELALVDAALTFIGQVHMSNGTWAATALASKTFLVNIAMFMPARRFIEATFASIEANQPSDGTSVFDQLQHEETPSPQLDISKDELRDYITMACQGEAPGSAARRYYDGEMSAKEFAAVMNRHISLGHRFKRIFGFSAHDMRTHEFARQCLTYDELKQFVKPEDTLTRVSNAAGLENFMAGMSRAKNMGHLIIGNAIVVALGGILSVNLLKTHAPVLAEIAYNIMGPSRDFAKLVRSICGLIKDSAIYFAYVISGDVTLLKWVEDSLTRALITQDRLESELRDRRGDQLRLKTLIEEHARDVSVKHGRVRMASTPQEANPWSQLLLRALQLRDEARRRACGSYKLESFVVTVDGPVGCGKTVAMKEWAERIVSAVLDEPAPDDGSFGDIFMQSDPKFFDGVVVGQHVIGYDDAWGHIAEAPAGDSSVKVFLQMVSEQAVMAPMSDVKDKGQIPLTPTFVFVAENKLQAAVGKFTPIIPAFLRRSQVHLAFRYRDGMHDGEAVDFDKDVIVQVQRYESPRTNDFRVGHMATLFEGTIKQAMAKVVQMAEAYGKRKRFELKQRSVHGVCRTCRQPGCELGAGVKRELHFDQAFQAEVARLWKEPQPKEVPEDEMPQQELVLVSATAMLFGVYAFYWFARSCRMAWRASLTEPDGTEHFGLWVAALVSIPLAWTAGWLALTGLLPMHVAASFLLQGDWKYWDDWLAIKSYVIRVAMSGDWLLRRWAPWLPAKYIMTRVAMGYSVSVQEAVWAFKQTSKYRILLRLIAALTLLATVSVAHAIVAPRPGAYPGLAVQPAVLDPLGVSHAINLNAAREEKPPDDVRRIARRLFLHRAGTTASAVLLPVGHNLGVTVAHLFPKTGDHLATMTFATSAGAARGTPYQLPKRNVEHVDSDFAVVRDAHIVVYDKQMRLQALPRVTREAWMVVFNKDGRQQMEQVIAIAIRDDVVSRKEWAFSVNGCYKVMRPTEYGTCGSPLVVRDEATGGWVVFATLMGSDNTSLSIFQAVTERMVRAVDLRLNEWPDGPSLQSLNLVSERLPVKVVDGPLHAKSALQWASGSSIVFVGRTVPELSGVPKCDMVKTSFHNVVEVEFGEPDTFVKPEWRPKVWPGRDYPYGMMTQHVEELNSSFDGLLDRQMECDAVHAEFERVFANTPAGRTLSTREALNGVPGRIKGINRKTSVGGWNRFGRKSAILVPSTCEHYPNGVTLPPAFEARVADIENQWANGQSVSPTCRIIPKMNEVRTKPVARQINVVELEWIVAARKLLEPIHEVMRANDEYGSMIGRSPVGPEWARVDTHMRAVNGQKGVDADGVAFDKRHGRTMRSEVRRKYAFVGARLGYTPRELKMLSQLLEDMFHAWQCFMGEVFLALFGLITGVPGTGDIQTLIGWTIVRVCLVVMYGAMVLRDNKFYSVHGGDDLKMAIAAALKFSGEQFAETMLLLGYKYTSDTDKSKPPEEVPHEDTTFYKRRFLHADGRVLAPLAEKSVRKMLMWRDASAEVSVRQQEADILATAVSESFLLGEAAYGPAAARIARIGAAAGYHVTIPSWGEFAARFDRGELKTWHYEPDIAIGTLCDCDRLISNVSSVQIDASNPAPAAPQQLDTVDGGGEQVIQAEGRQLALPLLREVSQALMRPVIIGETSWTAGLSTSVYPLSGLLANGILGRNLDYFFAHRAVLCIKLSVVLPPMSCGVLVASLYANNNVDAATSKSCDNVNQIITHDASVLIDVAVGNSAVLRKQTPRWTDATFTFSSDPLRGLHCLRLALAELVPVATAMSGGSITPTIFSWAWLEDAEQLGPTPINNVSDEWVARYSDRVLKFAMASGSVAGGVLRAGHALSGALIAAGFAFVAQLPEITWMRTRFLPMFATAEGVDSAVRLALAPKSMTVDNQRIFRGTSEDLLSFSSLLRRPSLFGTFVWSSSHTAHTRLIIIAVHPCCGGNAGTPLSWLCSMFNQWTGSLRITLYISCPSTARGSLIVAYTPNRTTTGAYADLTQQQPMVIDVAGSTSVTFDIGWHSELASLKVNDVVWPAYNAFGGAFLPNGYLSVFVQQPLNTSGATAFSTSVVITAVPGDDFALFDPNLDVPQYINMVSSTTSPLFQASSRHFEHRIEGSRRTPEQLASIGGGELITSLRDLLKRKAPHYSKRFAGAAATAEAMDLPHFVTGDNTQQGASDPTFQVLACFVSHAAIPFAAYAGSTRHTVMFAQTGTTTTNTGGQPVWLTVARRPAGNGLGAQAWTYGTNTVGTQLLSFLEIGQGADIATSAVFEQAVSVECPYVDQQFARAVPLAAADGDAAIRVGVVWPGSHPDNLAIVDFVSAGDDFDLFEWIGVWSPTLTPPAINYWSTAA